VLAGLLCCEMVARRGCLIRQGNSKRLFAEVGSFYPLRENFRLTPEVQAKFTEKLRRDPTEFCGSKVASVVRIDGLKLVLADGSWVCYRLSGTEPVVRVYTEARSREGLEKFKQGSKIMDLRLGPPSRKRIFLRQYSSEGLRAVFEEQAPKAEEMARPIRGADASGVGRGSSSSGAA